MNFLLSNRTVTLGAVGLMLFLAYDNYKEYKKEYTPEYYKKQEVFYKGVNQTESKGANAKHSINFDPHKDPDDYSLTEKVIYKVFKNDIEKAKQISGQAALRFNTNHDTQTIRGMNNQLGRFTPPPPQQQAIAGSSDDTPLIFGAKGGDKLTFSYKVRELENAIPYSKQIILGKKTAPQAIEKALIGMTVGEKRLTKLALKEIDKNSQSDEKVVIEITLHKIG